MCLYNDNYIAAWRFYKGKILLVLIGLKEGKVVKFLEDNHMDFYCIQKINHPKYGK